MAPKFEIILLNHPELDGGKNSIMARSYRSVFMPLDVF